MQLSWSSHSPQATAPGRHGSPAADNRKRCGAARPSTARHCLHGAARQGAAWVASSGRAAPPEELGGLRRALFEHARGRPRCEGEVQVRGARRLEGALAAGAREPLVATSRQGRWEVGRGRGEAGEGTRREAGGKRMHARRVGWIGDGREASYGDRKGRNQAATRRLLRRASLRRIDGP
jgi:hypothetical protein